MSDTDGSGPGDSKPKLIVDEDWKSEAQREKEKLSEQAAKSAEQKAEADAKPIEFGDIVRMFASQAALYLGLIPDPQTQQRMLAPELAAMNIDMLAVLETKTKGNLDDKEAEELSQTVRELRAVFVETTQAVKQAIAEGKINPDGSPGPNAPAGAPGVAGMGVPPVGGV
ncbi:MAG: DUF1844 domain-containing protein [Planctomycetota bacterium]